MNFKKPVRSWKLRCRRRLYLRRFLIFSLVLVQIKNASTNVTVNSDYDYDSAIVKVRKCCRLTEYFDVNRGSCAPWTNSTSTSMSIRNSDRFQWSSVDADGKSVSWILPNKFYKRSNESNYRPIIKFDSSLIGMPHCSSGKVKDIRNSIRTELEKIPEESDWNTTIEWDGNFTDKSYFSFAPGDSMLQEVTGPHSLILYHNPEHYCLDMTRENLIFRICPCSDQQPCIRKCCPPGEHLNLLDWERDYCVSDTDSFGNSDDADDNDNFKDVSHSHRWELPLHSNLGVPLTKLQSRFIVGDVSNCTETPLVFSSGWSLDDFVHSVFTIHPSGKPQLFDSRNHSWKFFHHYSDLCFDKMEDDTSQVCPAESEIILLCYQQQKQETSENKGFYWVFKIMLGLATIVLLITAIIVFLLLETKNIHSWTRLAYVLSHFSFFFLLGLTHVNAVASSPPERRSSCVAVAVMIHFTGLVTACWLSIINFDLWWTFRVLKPRSGEVLDIRRFVCYTMFSFGLPSIIIAIAWGIQSNEPEFTCRINIQEKRPIAPNYGADLRCAMSLEARPAYWFGPLVILLVANLIFFLTTTCRMVGLQRMTRRASIESTSGSQTQSRQIFVKIFIVSGVTWWVEIIQWFFSHKNPDAWYMLLLDMIHFVQAFALFFIFVCKRDVIRNLQIKYPIITKVIPPVPRLQRSGTLSTDPHSTSMSIRIFNRLNSRKISTTSIASTDANRPKPDAVLMSITSTSNQPPPISILSTSVNSKSAANSTSTPRENELKKHVQIHEPTRSSCSDSESDREGQRDIDIGGMENIDLEDGDDVKCIK